MLLILYMEYVARCGGEPRYDYITWLDTIRGFAEEIGCTFGDMVRYEIDPAYTGA